MLCSVLIAFSAVLGQNVHGSGEEILKRVEEEFAAVQDYVVTLDVVADVEQMNIPPMEVTMYYKHPDKFHFESTGFALLPREGLAFNVARILSRFSIEAVEPGSESGQVRMTLRPKNDAERVTRLELAIDTTRWKPARVRTTLAGGRTMTARFTYRTFDGFLMPSELRVEFESPPADTTDMPITMPGAVPRAPMPRSGSVTIRYRDYRINVGLTDDIFKK
jgi:outer membrane lipoprotein-sorting protein